MDNTLPTTSQHFSEAETSFSCFRRAQPRSDQVALDGLLASAGQPLAAAAYPADILPCEVFLLSMILEKHKEVMCLRQQVDEWRHV